MKTTERDVEQITRREQMFAYLLYKEKGMEAAINTYPQHRQFIERVKNKSYQEVKGKLLNTIR